MAYINNVHKMYMLQVSSRASGGPAEGQGRRVLAAGPGRHAGEPGYACMCMYAVYIIVYGIISCIRMYAT